MTLWRGTKPLVLASGSRVRRQLLEDAGIPLELRPAEIDERAVEAQSRPASPDQIAVVLATRKGEWVSAANPGRLVLAADQVMAADSRIYHKPPDRAAAREKLLSLLGKTHELHSAVTLHDDGKLVFKHCGTARLTMREASESFVDEYLDAAGPTVLQSVGGYQLEGIGIQLFSRIEGDYFTILGLPMLPVLNFLQSKQYLNA